MIKSTKKVLSLLLSIVMIISLFTGLEISSFAEDDILSYLTYKIVDGKVMITDCDESISGDVVIPDTIEGYPVTIIGAAAFNNCTEITSVTIPDSVTLIGDWVFAACTGLTSVTIPDSVEAISYRAFSNCTRLTNITIPDSVISISDFAFSGCEKLTDITIPDSVTFIGDYVFSACTNLTNITISDSVISIGAESFKNTAYYNKESNWENNILYIGKYLITAKHDITECTVKDGTLVIARGAFGRCTELTSITIPDSVTCIGPEAFNNTAYYSNESNWKNNVLYIGKYLIAAKPDIAECTVKDGTAAIADGTFLGCTKLKDIKISNSVKHIGLLTFYGCTGLASITIPDSATTIDYSAFYGCTGLTSITIPDSVTTIGNGAFYGCTGLTSITIPDSVIKIGDYAFGINSINNSGYELIDGFTIYGYKGSEAEVYANKYGINFVSTSVIGKEDLVVNNDSIKVNSENDYATISTGISADELKEMIENDDFVIVDKNGTEISKNALVGTGAKIQVINKDGNIVNEYTVIVPTDIDGNGKTTAADARLALRASAKIDTINGIYAVAADANNDKKITAMDARTILRKAAGLE